MKLHARRRLAPALWFAASVLLLAAPVRGDAAATYKSKCAVCHASNGSGDTAVGKSLKLGDLRSPAVQKQTDAQLIAMISDGKGGMPGYKDKLSADEIKQLAAYLRVLGKKK